MSRLIIFGAPEAPPMQKHQDEAEGNIQNTDAEQFELYQKQIVDPSLQRSLKRESVSFKIIRVLKGCQGQAASHLVIQLAERDAIILLSQKICIGFNKCTVKHYISIQRSFKCQLICYTTINSPNEEACACCGGIHNARD